MQQKSGGLSMITMPEDEREWFRELNEEAVRRCLDPKEWPIPEEQFDQRYSRGGLDGWLEAILDGLSPSQALDRHLRIRNGNAR